MKNTHSCKRSSRSASGVAINEYAGVLAGCALVVALTFSLAHPTLLSSISRAFSSLVSQLQGADQAAGVVSGTGATGTTGSSGGSG